MASPRVIIFGPTGHVGSAAAVAAIELGAHVILAMRDTTKAIPGLKEDSNGSYERVEADLSKPETVAAAIKATKATKAFFYMARGSTDHMKATITAMKDSGIKEPCFLSSFTIQQELEEIPPSDLIPYMHGQVELNLQAVFGKDGYYAARGGSFVTNILEYVEDIKKGEVKAHCPDVYIDSVVQDDIGRVCAALLIKGSPDKKIVTVYGPRTRPLRTALTLLAAKMGIKDVKITKATTDEVYQKLAGRGIPPPVATYIATRDVEANPAHGELQCWGVQVTEEELNHVEKYTGKKGTEFEDWLESNKQLFV